MLEVGLSDVSMFVLNQRNQGFSRLGLAYKHLWDDHHSSYLSKSRGEQDGISYSV